MTRSLLPGWQTSSRRMMGLVPCLDAAVMQAHDQGRARAALGRVRGSAGSGARFFREARMCSDVDKHELLRRWLFHNQTRVPRTNVRGGWYVSELR
ncbi:hypothetical protein [Glutamicibacter ardleyensis]|uniref:hypothetical protein n=1 Tax=Glutamicibacter ardleyensis TaxID=225894 RepID=UPI003FD0A2F3